MAQTHEHPQTGVRCPVKRIGSSKAHPTPLAMSGTGSTGKRGNARAPLSGLGSVGGVSSRQKNALLGYSGTSEPIAQTPAASQNQPTFDQRTEIGKDQGQIAREGIRIGER